MKLHIRNMVCQRCRMVVKNILEDQGFHPLSVSLGEAELGNEELTTAQRDQLNIALKEVGFELIDDHKSQLIEKIRNLIISIVHHSEEPLLLKHSEYLSGKLNHEYTYLSRLFSEVEGITIEQYLIAQRIEKAKELLIYDELSLTDIADRLHYSSVAHLSAQFKKITGMTPTQFKQMVNRSRKPLDQVGKNL